MSPVTDQPSVIVWGNCQSTPLAALLADPLASYGWAVRLVPPVFEIDEAGLAEVQRLLPSAAALITQPVRDAYRIPGCGSAQLIDRLGPDALAVTIPVTYDTSAFPYQVNAHAGDGSRVDAPLTDYHDLRCLVAAEQGLTVEQTLSWWPSPTPSMVTDNARASIAELERREAMLDVQVSDLLVGPAMFTLSHPTNLTLAETARRILAVLGAPTDVVVPEREFLGARRAPVEQAVVDALDWPTEARRDTWVVDRREVPAAEVIAAHLACYAANPDIVGDARQRFADRLALLEL